MQWLMTSHVRCYHQHYHSSGHVWQGRFKAFPIQSDEHRWTVLRYVEGNALRADMVAKAQDWSWSSLRWWNRRDCPGFLNEGPLVRPGTWIRHVNNPQTDAELEVLRQSIARDNPFGQPSWQRRTATRLGLASTLRPRGRPRKISPKNKPSSK
jgi:putative transposase